MAQGAKVLWDSGKSLLLSRSPSHETLEMKVLCELPRVEQEKGFQAHWIMASTLDIIFCFMVGSAG